MAEKSDRVAVVDDFVTKMIDEEEQHANEAEWQLWRGKKSFLA